MSMQLPRSRLAKIGPTVSINGRPTTRPVQRLRGLLGLHSTTACVSQPAFAMRSFRSWFECSRRSRKSCKRLFRIVPRRAPQRVSDQFTRARSCSAAVRLALAAVRQRFIPRANSSQNSSKRSCRDPRYPRGRDSGLRTDSTARLTDGTLRAGRLRPHVTGN
jgi:hypothetical protein